MTNQFLIEIKIPTYNAEKTIDQTIRSLLSQTYKNFKLYIYDNCSTDSTLELISKFNDDRIVVIASERNNGWKWNFDRCLKSFGHKYTLIAHSDDIYHPQFLEINLETINKNKNVGLIFSAGKNFRSENSIKFSLFDSNLQEIEIERIDSHARLLMMLAKNGNFLYCPSAFGRTEVFSDLICKFDASKFGGAADIDAWLRVSLLKEILIIKSPVIFYYRLSSSQLSELDRNRDGGDLLSLCLIDHLNLLKDKRGFDFVCFYQQLDWHSIFHKAFLDGCRKQNIILNITTTLTKVNEIFNLKLVSLKRRTLLIGIILLFSLIKMLPRIFSKPLIISMARLAR